jgi:hypothetical protein
MHTLLVRCFVIALALPIGGCVSMKYYTPNPDTHQLDEIAEFSGDARISLVNGQPSTEERLYDKKAKYNANYNAWTDVAIQVANRELTARGLSIEEGADKQLTMAIEDVITETGWTQIQTRVIMKVQTGDGYSSQYIGRNHSVMIAKLERQADGAVMRAVAAMLGDPEIVMYLTN